MLCLVAQLCLTLCNPRVSHQATLPMGIPQARIPRWVVMPSSRGSSQPRDQNRSPAVQADPLLSQPPGKPINTGVASLSLLQGGLPNPGFELGSPTLYMDSLPAELPRKPIKLPHDPEITLLGIRPEKTIIQKDTCTQMFLAPVSTISTTWKKHRCLSMNG